MAQESRFLFLLTLTLMSISGLIASDIFLPALPEMADVFSLTSSQAQSLLSVFLIGLGIMQLIYGPISDRVGRRKPLLCGMVLFCFASLAIPFAQTLEQLIVLRLLQAMGACAGIALGRAIVADLYSKEEAGRMFLLIFPIVGLSPAFAPMIGGGLAHIFGWKACFFFIAGFAFLLVNLVMFFQPETHPIEKRIQSSPFLMKKIYQELFKSRVFVHYALIPCFAYAAYFSYISTSALLLSAQGFTPTQIGFSYAPLSFTYVIGNLLARRIMKIRSLDEVLFGGYILFLMGGIGMAIAFNFAPHSFILTIGATCILTLGNGFLLPLGTAGSVTSVPRLSGSAAGLMGFMQLIFTGLSAQFIGFVSNHHPERFGTMMGILTFIGFILFLRGASTLKNV